MNLEKDAELKANAGKSVGEELNAKAKAGKEAGEGAGSKYSIDFALGAMSLILLYISLKFFISVFAMEFAFNHPSFVDNWLKHKVGINYNETTLYVFSSFWSVFLCALAYKGFVYLDKKYFSAQKWGFLFKAILWALPLLIFTATRIDIKAWKEGEYAGVLVRNYAYANPAKFIKMQDFDYNAVGYLVFDENRQPHFIVAELKEGRNKVEVATDFLSMQSALTLKTVEGGVKVTKFWASGKINHSQAELGEESKIYGGGSFVNTLSGVAIARDSSAVTDNLDFTSTVAYPNYLFIYVAGGDNVSSGGQKFQATKSKQGENDKSEVTDEK